jgi:ABC-type oligopeptide transport system substrate-binding subunit
MPFPEAPSGRGQRSRAEALFLCACLVLIWCCAAPESAAEQEGITERPLAQPHKPGGATMFTELTPQQTGIVSTNDYSDPKMWGDLLREFNVGAMGTGVANGDYDGDGRRLHRKQDRELPSVSEPGQLEV